MSNGSMLPPDIRQGMEARRRAESPVSGVGAAAAENAATAQQKAFALDPNAREAERAREEEPEPEVEEKVELTVCPNQRCRRDLQKDWSYCAVCGQDLVKDGPAARLGLKFTEEDLDSYLFKGEIVRDLNLLGSHNITVKSSQPQDMRDIDDFIMNGKWNKDDKGEDRPISDFYLRQINSMCITAAAVMKMDGESIGDTLGKRVEWLDKQGSALVDMVSMKASWYNQAVAAYLNDKDAIRGS